MSKRTDILKKANEATCGNREQDYGNPESNFQLIANLWSAYLDTIVTPVDVGMMMVMLKAARIKSGRLHEDNFIDGAGYFACAGEIACAEAAFQEEYTKKALEHIFGGHQ